MASVLGNCPYCFSNWVQGGSGQYVCRDCDYEWEDEPEDNE